MVHFGFTRRTNTLFKLEFSLDYNNLEEARSGTVQPLETSEWSMRVWSQNSGKDPDLRINESFEVEAIYTKLLNQWGSGDEIPCDSAIPGEDKLIFDVDVENLRANDRIPSSKKK